MLKIWGRLSSVNVQKVVWCADELGLQYERIEAGGKFGIVDTPEYRAMNPNALVPVIEDGDFVLWESNAIVRYLALQYGKGTLCPIDVQARADADRWMDWQAVTYNPCLGPAFVQLFRTPIEKRDNAIIEKARVETEKKLKLLDAHLATHQWLTGDTFTMADIPAGCSTDRWYKLPIARATHPNVERWYAAIRERTGAKTVTEQVIS